jgi:hypothetical protein
MRSDAEALHRADVPRRTWIHGRRRGGTILARWSSLLALVLVAGCGGARRVELAIANFQERTVWVAFALLSDPGALDGYTTQELVDPERVGELNEVKGVVDVTVMSVQPGAAPEQRAFSTEDFPLKTGWLVAAALLPGEPTCARSRVEIDTGSKLTFSISVRNDCVEVTKL